MSNSDKPVAGLAVGGTSAGDLVLINLASVSVSFGRSRVLRNISFPIYENRVTAIIGASGCGKSVLLKAICGLLHETSQDALVTGSISYQGKEVLSLRGASLREFQRRVIYVNQRPVVFPGSVYDKITLPPPDW